MTKRKSTKQPPKIDKTVKRKRKMSNINYTKNKGTHVLWKGKQFLFH